MIPACSSGHASSPVSAGLANERGSSHETSAWPPQVNESEAISDTGSRQNQKSSDAAGESGAEADDERGPTYSLLFPASSKTYKGLQTQSLPDGVGERLPNERAATIPNVTEIEDHSCGPFLHFKSDQQDLKALEQIRRRKRQKMERMRRLIEVGLILVICISSLKQSLLHDQYAISIDSDTARLEASSALAVFTTTLFVVLLLYAFQGLSFVAEIILSEKDKKRLKRSPSRISDPSAHLYPLFLPICIALSISPLDYAATVVACTLTICSVSMIRYPASASPYFFYMRWTLSLLPAWWTFPSSAIQYPTFSDVAPSHSSRRESVILCNVPLILPLYHALLHSIQSITTSSLMPTELELLSTSLISLLMLSDSPQSHILTALVWIGGVSVLTLCQIPIQVGLNLARIPNRRFLKSDRRRSLREYASGLLGHLIARTAFWDSSIYTLRAECPASDETVDRIDAPRPCSVGGSGHAIRLHRHQASSPKPKIRASSRDDPFGLTTQLTAQEAQYWIWLTAVFVYIVLIFVVVFPVRILVKHNALHGVEPLHWFITYIIPFNPRLDPARTNEVLEMQKSSIFSDKLQTISPSYEWTTDSPSTRLRITAWCLSIVIIGVMAAHRLNTVLAVDSRRKLFHGMMVVMFLPTIFMDPTYISLAFIIVLALFLILELLRAAQLPPLSRPLTQYLMPYVDSRDNRGPVVISHIFLLLGCALPLWLSLAASDTSALDERNSWHTEQRDLGMVSGVICIGLGDAAASLVGRRYGRKRWGWAGGKSIEGTVAFTVAVTTGLCIAQLWLSYGRWHSDFPVPKDMNRASLASGMAIRSSISRKFLSKAILASAGAGMSEAVLSSANDNVVVSLILWLLIRTLRI